MIPREQVTGIVVAHGQAEEAVRRHFPYWYRVCGEVAFFTPLDNSIPELPNQFSIGWNGRYSPQTSLRVREGLRYAAWRGRPFTLFMEWDAMVWGPLGDELSAALASHDYDESDVVASWCQGDGMPRVIDAGGCQIRFSGAPYLHSPTLFGLGALRRTVEQMDVMAMDEEHGYSDRYIGAACADAEVPIVDLRSHRLAWSSEAIDMPEKVEACREAVAGGALFSHGVKTKEVLEAILPESQWAKEDPA